LPLTTDSLEVPTFWRPHRSARTDWRDVVCARCRHRI